MTARDEFLSIASHELRTPLSTLKLQTAGLSRWLSRASLPEHEPHLLKHFAVIDRQVARLEKLTTELLDVSRISSGRLELHREPFNLVVLVREIVERFRADQARGSSSIVFESAPSVVGEWDPFRIDQVASNLVVNAIRYGEGKPVHVSVHAVNDAARIIVRDEGIGIAADHKERIFNGSNGRCRRRTTAAWDWASGLRGGSSTPTMAPSTSPASQGWEPPLR